MTVISSGVAFSAVKSIDVDNVYGPGNDSEDSETLQKPLGTPMQLQVSMVTTVVRPMSSSEFEAAMNFINNSKESIKGIFKWGKDFYDKNEATFKKIKGTFTVLMGVGDIVSGIQKFRPEEENPMVKNLAELTNDVKALSEKLTDNFAEMKNFISQQTFFTDIINPATVLTMYMMDCLAYPGEDSKKNFSMAYEQLSPLEMQSHLNAYLKQKTTNPMRVSMESGKEKTKEEFEKWEDIYCRVMAQFVILEAFACGLLGTEGDVSFDQLTDASNEVLKEIHQLKEDYGDENWEKFKKFLTPWLQANALLPNIAKANKLEEILTGYFIPDAFYICLTDSANSGEHFTYTCANEEKQLIVANYNASLFALNSKCFVYRSRSAYKVTSDKHQELIEKVKNCKDKLRWSGSLGNVIENQLIDSKLLPNDGFILLVSNTKNPIIQEASHMETGSIWFHGPGYQSAVFMDNDIQKEYELLVGFP